MSENTHKKRNKRLILVLILAAIVLSFAVITNPKIFPGLAEFWNRIFGDVTEVSKTIKFDWIALVKCALIIMVMIIITNVVKMITEKAQPKSNKGKSIVSMLNSIISYACAVIGIVWCLSAIGINLSTIFASIGIVALIIGFAAESLIEDVITGVFLVFEDEFNVGDIIEIDGFRGTVTSIGVRTTCIQNPAGNVKIMNNSDIRNVLNRSKAQTAAVVDIPIAYEADVEETERILLQILDRIPEEHPDVFKEVPKYLGVQELAGSSVNLRVVAQVDDKDVFTATRILNRDIKVGFDRVGISVPFQQVVIHQAGDDK